MLPPGNRRPAFHWEKYRQSEGDSCIANEPPENAQWNTPLISWHKPAPIPSTFPSLALIHLSLSPCLSLGWALTRLQASGLAESITRKERPRSIYTLHTQPDGVALHYICPTPEAVHWASPRGSLSTATWRGHVPPCRKGKDNLSLVVVQNLQEKLRQRKSISVLPRDPCISGC